VDVLRPSLEEILQVGGGAFGFGLGRLGASHARQEGVPKGGESGGLVCLGKGLLGKGGAAGVKGGRLGRKWKGVRFGL
jgi:hypothetical protein